MFFTPELLAKRDSGIGLIWMAATLGKTSIGKLNRRNVLSANISKLCELVAEPTEPLALRLSSNLLVGVARVYKVKYDTFLAEVTTCFTTLKRTILEIDAGEASVAINLTSGSVRPDTITLNVPEPGTAMGLEMDFNHFMWQDFMEAASVPAADGRHSSPPGITSQDFTGTQTQTQNDRPLYMLEESYEFLTSNEPAGLDTTAMDLDILGDEFDLGLGQDAFGDIVPLDDSGPIDPSSAAKKSELKPKSTNKEMNLDPMYAREPSVPFESLNLDDWAIGVHPSSSGFGLPGSGCVVGLSSRAGSVEPLSFQSQEPQPFGADAPALAQAPENVTGGEKEVAPTAPKKAKKKARAIQDRHTELTDDELIASRNNYLKEQGKIRIEVELRRQERDAIRVVDVWMEGVPYGSLEDWLKKSFKDLTGDKSTKRKRDENDGFAVPPLPKRRREETPSQAPEIGRNAGTPMMNFGDEYDWGMGSIDPEFLRSSSVERGIHPSRHASQAPEDINISQRSGLLPWDNVGISSSTNGDIGPLNLPEREEHITVRLKSFSHSRQGSSVTLSRLSASPGKFGPGLDEFGLDAFEFGNPGWIAEGQPTQIEVTLEKNSFKFLEYARMQTRALSDPSGGVMFSSIAPNESSTAHVAASAFYHTLVLATKSAVHVKQTEPFGDLAIYTLHVNGRHSQMLLKSHVPRARRWLQFCGTAMVTGIIFHLVLVGLGSTEIVRQRVPVSVSDWLPGGPKSADNRTIVNAKPDCPTFSKPVLPPKTQAQKVAEEEGPWTMDQIREMAGRTKGYYGRDYSLGLGWNNVRYIFEASLLHAQLLNRTLVLPSFVYARACEWDVQVCASFAPMVNRGDAIGWGEWRNLPMEKQMGWRVPIGLMLDMNHLRKAHPVITVAEYLQLNGMSPSIEWSNGAWHREMYQNDGKVSIHEIPNNEYDPEPTVRVEMLPSHPPGDEDSVFSKMLFVALGDKRTVMDLNEAAGILRGHAEFSGDDQLESFLRDNGWEVLHTYRGTLGMDYTKSVVEPIKQVAPRSRLRGMFDDYNHIDAEVLVLAGETHLNRKPGGVRFVYPEQQAHFASTVLHEMRPTGPIRRLAARLHERMEKIVGGRQWIGAHMRRGDFVHQGWVMEHSIEKHLGRIMQRLSNGRKILHEIHDNGKIQIYDVPNVEPERDVYDRPPPLEGDSFYIATDERSMHGRGYIRSNGGVLIDDILTLEDRQEFGWPIMLTDVLAIVEQTLLSHSAYFYAHAMSSVGGGVVNMRAARGADRRSALID
ncbi:unnamed protein product [Rhizoctonia solani]|uniref:Rad21/Rec8-like protein N-terminal domain-containing protein n=1 Tax=Rhizoctonia solani TaxID=456999 RepID=A0A8H2XEU1_9AGAM|nr:unnamed protein product [Rhizoctonia solani]